MPKDINKSDSRSGEVTKEPKRVSKFKFKREMRELVNEIHNSNKNLFPATFLRYQRSQIGDQYE